MVFNKPSTEINVSGAYAFQGSVLSSAQNYIDNSFPYLMDIRGSNVLAGTNTISGTLNILSGGSLDVESGAVLTISGLLASNLEWESSLSTPSLLQATPSTDSTVGNITIQASDAYASAMTHTSGGSITISTGNPTTGGTNGTLTLQVGHGIGSSSSFLIGNGVTGNTTINASALSVSTSGLVVTNDNASVEILPTGASAVSGFVPGALTVAPWNQNGSGLLPAILCNNWTPYTVSTAASGSNAVAASLTVPILRAFWVEMVWIRRGVTGVVVLGNRSATSVIVASSGAVTINGVSALYSGGGFDSASNLTVTSTGNNNLTITAVAQTAYMDWQIFVNLVAI